MKPKGWRNNSHGHKLAAMGITLPKNYKNLEWEDQWEALRKIKVPVKLTGEDIWLLQNGDYQDVEIVLENLEKQIPKELINKVKQ